MNELPAHSVEIEQGVLATWLLDKEVCLAWKPDPDLFFGVSNQLPMPKVAEACAQLWNGKQAFSLPELLGHMLANGNWGDQLALGLNEFAMYPALGDFWGGVSKLKELAALRRFRADASAVVGNISAASDLSAVQAEMGRALTASVEVRGSSVALSRDIFRRAIDEVNAGEKSVRFCTSGFADIDARTGGIREGKCWLYGADSYWGKSTLLAMMADVNLIWGKRILVVSCEDTEQDFAQRLACRRANMNASKVRDRRLEKHERAAYGSSCVELSELPYFFIDGVGKTSAVLAAEIRTAIHAHNIDLTFFDYLQALEGKDDNNRTGDLRRAGRELTAAVKQTNTAGVFFSQVTRSKEDIHKIPTKKDIRDCRDLSNAAEVVLMGWVTKAGDRMLHLDKAKGAKGGLTTEIRWNSHSASFIHTAEGQLGLYDDED